VGAPQSLVFNVTPIYLFLAKNAYILKHLHFASISTVGRRSMLRRMVALPPVTRLSVAPMVR
jgi:hypothetical protein